MGYKSGGLSYFEDGGSADQEEQTTTSVQAKPIAAKGKFAMPTLAGNVPVNESVLEQMGRLYMQRQEQRGGMRGFLNAIKDASAWGVGPEAVTARDKLRQEQEAEDMQFGSQIAQYRSALASQKAFEEFRDRTYGPGADQAGGPEGVKSMFGMPPEIRQALAKARTQAEHDKLYADWAKEKAKVEANPEYDVPKIPVVIKGPNGQYYRDVISARQLRADPEKYIRQDQLQPEQGKPAPAAYKPGPGPAPPSAAAPAPLQTAQAAPQGGAPAPQAGGQPPVPGPQAGAQPPMPGPAPVAAAPAMAPTPVSTAPAPTPTVAPAAPQGPAMVKTAAPARGRPPTAGELEQASEIEKQRQLEENKQGIAAQLESEKKAREKFIGETDPGAVATRTANLQRVQQLVAKDPQIAGILSQSGYASALGGLLSQGISTPSGPIGIKGISDAIAKTTPGMNMAARKELAQKLAALELDASQMMQGQGQISDSEREILRNSSIGLDDPSTLIHKTAKILERRQLMLKQMREIYGDGDQWKRFSQFQNSPKAKAVLDSYFKDITTLANSESVLGSQGAKSGAAPKVSPYSDAEKEKRYQEWKKSQGMK